MPLTYRVDSARRIVTITGDYAAAEEWKDLLGALSRDPAYQRGFCFLRDLRASAHPVDADTVMGIINVVKSFWGVLGAYRAAMLTRPGVDLPASIAHALAQDEEIPLRAFTAYDDAVAWLMEGCARNE